MYRPPPKTHTPPRPQVLLYLARALYDSNKLTEAQSCLKRAIHLAPTDYKLRFNYALTLQVCAWRGGASCRVGSGWVGSGRVGWGGVGWAACACGGVVQCGDERRIEPRRVHGLCADTCPLPYLPLLLLLLLTHALSVCVLSPSPPPPQRVYAATVPAYDFTS